MDEHWTRSKFKGKDGNLSLGDVQLGISRIKLRDGVPEQDLVWCVNLAFGQVRECKLREQSRKCVNSEKDVGDWNSEE